PQPTSPGWGALVHTPPHAPPRSPITSHSNPFSNNGMTFARAHQATCAETLASCISAAGNPSEPARSTEVAMSPTQISDKQTTKVPTAEAVDTKLEVVVIPVSDVDRAKRFYGSLGWRLDADFVFENGFRVVQFTPP